jgi:hypothetical protein
MAPEIVAIERQQIKRTGDSKLIGGAAVQNIELGQPFLIKTDHFRIENGSALDACRFLDNARIAVGPVVAVHRRTRPSRTWICSR